MIDSKYQFLVGDHVGMDDITDVMYKYVPNSTYSSFLKSLSALTKSGEEYAGYKAVAKQVIPNHYIFYFYKAT
jgi:hypothetical protein